MATAMGSWGGYELSRKLSLSLRDRELVINRTCARCRCAYEWDVHIAFFAEAAKFTAAQIASLTHGHATDDCWTSERDRVLIEAVDALHDHGDAPRFADVWRSGPGDHRPASASAIAASGSGECGVER